jgi:hypothetical protein
LAGGRKVTTRFGASSTRLGADTAVLVLGVAFALACARFARHDADATHLFREPTATRHQSPEKAAEVGAVEVETDAVRHVLDIRFAETRARTVRARDGAVLQGFDAVGDFVVAHGCATVASRIPESG